MLVPQILENSDLSQVISLALASVEGCSGQ